MALNEGDIDRMASHTPLLHLCDWTKGSLQAATAYVHQRSAITQIEALIRAVLRSIVYREYVGPIFQSQLSRVGPNKSNDVGCSNIQGDSSIRIKRT